MSDYQPGDIVRIVIENARVTEICRHGDGNGDDLRFTYEAKDGDQWPSAVWAQAPGVFVERVAPAEWPPKPGDLWRDRLGSVWFAFFGLDAREVFFIPADPVSGPLTTPSPSLVLEKSGPLTLVHREEVRS